MSPHMTPGLQYWRVAKFGKDGCCGKDHEMPVHAGHCNKMSKSPDQYHETICICLFISYMVLSEFTLRRAFE